MKYIHLSYNPYTITTEIMVKNKKGEYLPWENKNITPHLEKKRLQSWLRQTDNYKGFCGELKLALNDDITLEFQGRNVDYEDLEAAFATQAGGNQKVTVEKSATGQLSDDNVLHNLEELKISLEDSMLKDTEQVQNALEAYERFQNRQLQVAVIAPMSSGKSTLINALLGEELLAMSNKATTAKVTRIFNENTSKGFTFTLRDQEENILQAEQVATAEKLKETNAENKKTEDLFYIDMKGKIPGISTEHTQLVLLDTPGPNSAKNVDHGRVTNEVIQDSENCPIILYVMDATKIGVTDEDTLIKNIKATMEKDPQAKERMIFLLNRADEANPNNDSVKELVKEAEKTLKDHGILSPVILPISAKTQLLQSLLDSGSISKAKSEDDEDEDADERWTELKGLRKKLKDPARDFLACATLSPSCRKKVEDAKEKAVMKDGKVDKDKLTHIHSGIFTLQCVINEYLEKYAIPYKACTCLHAMTVQLEDLQAKAAFEDELSKSTEALEKAKAARDENKKKLLRLKINCQNLRDELSAAPETIDTKPFVDPYFAKILHEIGAICDQYQGQKEIPEETARTIQGEIEAIYKDKMPSVKDEIVIALSEKEMEDFDKLQVKIKIILDEFESIMSQFPHFDATKLQSVLGVQDLMQKQADYTVDAFLKGMNYQSYDKTEEKTRLVKNPERDGLFGFFNVFQPWEINETYTVDCGKHVDVFDFSLDIQENSKNNLDEYKAIIHRGMQGLYDEKRALTKDLVSNLELVMGVEELTMEEIIQKVADNTVEMDELSQKLSLLTSSKEQLNVIGQDRKETL